MSRRTILIVVAFLVLIGASALFLWPREARLRLRIVRRAEENGKSVVFFRVEGNGQRKIMITDVHEIIGVTWQIPTWASQGPPFGVASKRWTEFGVVTPTNTSVWKQCVWKLQVSVAEDQKLLTKIRITRSLLGPSAKLDKPTLKKALGIWNTFLPGSQQSIESDFITNAFSGL